MAIIGSLHLVTSNVAVTGIDASNATITWMTNEDANSTVVYGTTTSYGSSSTDGVMTEDHTVSLHSLSPGTIYHFQVVSIDLAGNSAISTDSTFNTTAIQNGTAVTNATSSTTFPWLNIETAVGAQQATVNVSTSPGAVQVSGNTVTVQNPGNGWSSLQFVGSGITTLDGNVSTPQVQSVSMQSEPVTASLGGTVGTVSTQIKIGLNQIISGVTLQQSVIQGATTTVADAFQVAATNNNLAVQAVAYSVQFQNTAQLDANLNSDGVKVNMTVDDAWVAANAPGGSVNNVRIFRLGDDGTEEVLSTTFLFRQGTTDYFEATSPNGLSTFGIVAVASSGTSGGGGGGGGSAYAGGGSTYGSGGGGGGSVQIAVPQGAPAAPQGAPAVPQQPGPAQISPTTTQSLSVAGLTVTTGASGIQTFTLDRTKAAQSGVSVSVDNNVITTNQPGLTLTIITSGSPSIEDDVISGTVQSVSIQTTPSAADLSFGSVSVSIDAALATIPENAAITTTISEMVSSDARSAFQQAAQDNNQQVEAIAYVMSVEKTNFAATGPATVTMTISPDWVTSHGGIQSVSIARMGDDKTVEILDTSYKGTDAQGSLVFEGNSPHGLSVFGITTVKTFETVQQKQPEAAPVALLVQAAFGTAGAVLGGIAGLIRSNYVIILVYAGLVACCILVYAGWLIRKRAQQKRK